MRIHRTMTAHGFQSDTLDSRPRALRALVQRLHMDNAGDAYPVAYPVTYRCERINGRRTLIVTNGPATHYLRIERQ